MHPSLRKIFDAIELHRKKTLESVSHLSSEQLNHVAPSGKWSIAQILGHLITGEKMSLLYIQKKIQGIEKAERSGLTEELKMILLTLSQRTPGLKFKAPRRLVEHTVVYSDIESFVREWDNVRKDLEKLVEKIPDEFITRKIYKHPRAGYLSIKHALLFFREHIIHHTPQIKRLLPQK